MAQMLISMKIFPEDITIDLEQLKLRIKSIVSQDSKIIRFDEEPIAFGLKALIVHVLMPEEKQDELEKVENGIRQISGVSNVETFMMQRW
jgi:elongation factor 1-beta